MYRARAGAGASDLSPRQVYFNRRHADDPEKLRQALDIFETRIVYEQIGEKFCILVAPFMAYMLSKDLEKEDRPSVEQLGEVTGITFAMEEFVDAMLAIAMASIVSTNSSIANVMPVTSRSCSTDGRSSFSRSFESMYAMNGAMRMQNFSPICS